MRYRFNPAKKTVVQDTSTSISTSEVLRTLNEGQPITVKKEGQEFIITTDNLSTRQIQKLTAL